MHVFFRYRGEEYFAGGIFRISNVCEILSSILRQMCEINLVRTLATEAHFHYLFALLLLSF